MKPTTEQLKIRFEAENEYLRELNDHETAGLFNMVWGWMNNCTNIEASEEFIKAVESLQKEFFPTMTRAEYRVAQEVAGAIDGLQKVQN